MRALFFIAVLAVLFVSPSLIAESFMDGDELYVDDGNFVIINDKLGLGTTDPSYIIHIKSGHIGVSGDMTIKHPAGGGAGNITFYDTSELVQNTVYRIHTSQHGSYSGTLCFNPSVSGASSAANTLFITPTGNIGAGTTNPVAKYSYSDWLRGYARNNAAGDTPVLKARWHEPIHQDYALIEYVVESGENTQLLIKIGNLLDDAQGVTTRSIDDAIFFYQGRNYESNSVGDPLVMQIKNGEVKAVATANAISDERRKERIATIEGAGEKLRQMEGVYFYFDYRGEIDSYNTNRQVGFIAQDVAPVVPELITLGEKYFAVSYPSVAPILIEGIKEQDSVLSEIDRRLSRLEKDK